MLLHCLGLQAIKTKKMGNSNNTVRVFGALFLGAAIGGVLGVLFAPEKGSETRKRLSAKGNDLTDAMKEKVQELIEEFRNEADAVKEKVNEYKENGKDKVNEYLEKGKGVVEQL